MSLSLSTPLLVRFRRLLVPPAAACVLVRPLLLVLLRPEVLPLAGLWVAAVRRLLRGGTISRL
jgi:hypothetical protein